MRKRHGDKGPPKRARCVTRICFDRALDVLATHKQSLNLPLQKVEPVGFACFRTPEHFAFPLGLQKTRLAVKTDEQPDM